MGFRTSIGFKRLSNDASLGSKQKLGHFLNSEMLPRTILSKPQIFFGGGKGEKAYPVPLRGKIEGEMESISSLIVSITIKMIQVRKQPC
jgi:hypothetical protein